MKNKEKNKKDKIKTEKKRKELLHLLKL